jgi:hypothetical protein
MLLLLFGKVLRSLVGLSSVTGTKPTAFSDDLLAFGLSRTTLPDLWPSFGDALSLILAAKQGNLAPVKITLMLNYST